MRTAFIRTFSITSFPPSAYSRLLHNVHSHLNL